MPDHEEDDYDETNNTEDFGSMTGGSNSQKKNEESFFEYMSTFTNAEKGHILNMIQYSGIAILPILTILKLMKIYLPDSNIFKPTSELIFEVVMQIIIILIAFFFIHKLVLYFPTYSQIPYSNISLLSGLLPLLFLMSTLDTKLSDKLNTIFDRLLSTLGIVKDPEESNESESSDSPREVALEMSNMNTLPVVSSMKAPSMNNIVENPMSSHQSYGGGEYLNNTLPAPMDSLGGSPF